MIQIKGGYRYFFYSFISPVGHNIWWENSRSNSQNHLFGPKNLVFLDTQVSPAPTHVSKLVSWLVGKQVTLSDFQSLVSNGRSNQKIQKTQYISF